LNGENKFDDEMRAKGMERSGFTVNACLDSAIDDISRIQQNIAQNDSKIREKIPISFPYGGYKSA